MPIFCLIANRRPTSTGGYGRIGALAGTVCLVDRLTPGPPVRATVAEPAAAAAFTLRTNRNTSGERGRNRITTSSSARSPTAVSATLDRSHGYWLCSTIDHRRRAS